MQAAATKEKAVRPRCQTSEIGRLGQQKPSARLQNRSPSWNDLIKPLEIHKKKKNDTSVDTASGGCSVARRLQFVDADDSAPLHCSQGVSLFSLTS